MTIEKSAEEFSEKPIVPLLLKSAAIGVLLFWLVGVWLLPERTLILKYFRGYMSVGVVTMFLGAYMYEKRGPITKKIGAWILAVGFACAGAFFALGFYLFYFSPMFK
ncbi:MAG: hypothetical protein JWP42_5221 [Pseudomonas sp.]|nr:hypothetical protein [Pseudomonas sp.]